MERHEFDFNQPQGSMSLLNLRNALRGLFQGDLFPLRPRATFILDDMEYPSDASAQSVWAGIGVTVGYSTTKQEGNFSLELAIDGTGNRTASKTQALDLSAYKTIKLWERVDVASSEFQFYLKDGDDNESYWDITSNGTLSTWQQDELDLTTPDSDSGTPADLSDIASWGFKGLDASKTYLIDTVKATCGLNVAVFDSIVGGFYNQVYIGSTKISFLGGSSPIITPPTTNSRISLLVIDNTGTLSWVDGTEASTPAEPTFPSDKIPICLVYCKTTMAKVVDYTDKDANPDEGYILKDVRPLLSIFLGTFLSLTDTPSSYSGAGGKYLKVNAGANAVEFADTKDTDGALTANSNDCLPSQKAVKTYADGKISKTTGGEFNAMTEKTVTVDDDIIVIEDSEASFAKKKVKKSNFAGGAGGYSNMQAFTSNGTWVRPAGVDRVYVKVQGAGGGGGFGGGSNESTYRFGSGGGAGGYSEAIVAVTGNVSVVVGAGGAGGNYSANGSSGGQSYFSASGANVRATGGDGGRTTNTYSYYAAGGAGGSGFNGNLNITGGYGAETPSVGSSAHGGSCPLGFSAIGNNSTGYGAGGFGGARGEGFSAKTGAGAGKNGIVIVYWSE